MYFTIEDYRKIERWLRENSVKDTEFPEVSNLSLDENLPIIQDNKNKKTSLKNLINFLNINLLRADSELDINSTNPIQNQAVSKVIYELQNRKFIKIVEELPPISNAENDVVYILLDEVGEGNNLFTEWIKVNNIWEKVGEFSTEIDLTPYLKIQDSPFEKGEAENSAVIKGGNNQATNVNEVALGNYNKSNSDTCFSIGIGTSDTDRKNAFEVKKNGDIYIEGVEGKIQDKLNEKVGEVENIPFEKGSAENSAVLKGGNNQVISKGGVAVGSNNVVGLKGWYYKALRINTATKTIDVFLTKNQTIPISGKPSNIETDIVCNLITGDTISIINDKKYDNKFVVVNTSFLSNGFIRIQAIDDLPFTTIEQELILDTEDYSIYCLSKPDAGIADIGQGSFAAGCYNKATNGKSSALGFNNHAYGKFSFTEGRDNEAGYAAHAEGRENIASGEQSHAEGKSTIASGKCSHAEGRNTVSVGLNSHAEGEGTTVEGTTSLSVGAHGRSSHVEGIATTTGEYDEQIGIWSKGAAAHAEGNSTIASGNYSHAEGSETHASGWQAHAEGYSTKAIGNRSHAEGSGTETHNLSEHAQGRFNQSTESYDTSKATQFSIGIGESAHDRKNAIEVKQNGDIYIIGLGNFNGYNSSDATPLQEIIANLL